ncbi:MAG: hypothetical protein ACJASX_004579 [Limisphaerales bacterium]|jgi:hypothetical protein
MRLTRVGFVDNLCLMNKLFLSLLLTLASGVQTNAAAPQYEVVPNYLKLPTGLDKMGNAHGDVAIAANGDVYVSITAGPKAGIQVYNSSGKYIRNVAGAPKDFHGFVIRKDKGGEYIYGASLGGQKIYKLTLTGDRVLTISGDTIPDKFKKKGRGKNAKPGLRLTAMDVAPNGDLFVVDGYSNDYIHHFDRKGNYKNSFGGRGKAPYNFRTLHKIAVDTRFKPARIIGVDRENMRAVHMSLDGKFMGVINHELLRPAAVAIHGDYAAIGEIKGRVALLDKEGNIVAKIGFNDVPENAMNNKTPPARWFPGIFTAPHGLAFNAKGDLFVAEYSIFGRVHRLNLKD